MLLRKELESLELTYPDEYSTVSNITETSAVSTPAKVITFHFSFIQIKLGETEWFCISNQTI